MKELIIKITYDDTDCYQGKGEAADAILSAIDGEMQIGIEGDGIVNKGWDIEVVKCSDNEED
jgi:hypothetical protein